MPIDWTPFVDLVCRHQRFLLTTHIRPDGDGLGSMLALAEVLQLHGKQTRQVVASALPPRYDFLYTPDLGVERFTLPGDEWRDVDAVIVIDTGTWNQLGDFGPFLRSLPVTKIVIDHHRTQDDLGAIRFLDVTAEAAGRLSYEAITALGGPLPERAARALFLALAMDTGWFRHSNTNLATMTLAGQLVEAGARPDQIYDLIYEQNTPGRMRLVGLALSRLQVVHDGRTAYAEVLRTDYAVTGATPQDTEDLVNYPRSVAGVEVALLFMEQPRGGVKVSFRSRQRVDVGSLAEQFGGGGHRLASGAVIDAPLEEARARVLTAIAQVLPPGS